MTTTRDNDSTDPAGLELMAIPKATLEKLLNHAASAAHLVGHLDVPIAAGPLGNHVDAIAHGLTELLGNAHRRTEDAAPAVALMERVPDISERVPCYSDLELDFLWDRAILATLLEHGAPAAARLVGQIETGTAPRDARDLLARDLLAKNTDQIAALRELLGKLHLIVTHAPDPARFVIGSDDESMRPHTLAAPEQSARSTLASHELAPAPGSGLRIAEPAAGARPACE